MFWKPACSNLFAAEADLEIKKETVSCQMVSHIRRKRQRKVDDKLKKTSIQIDSTFIHIRYNGGATIMASEHSDFWITIKNATAITSVIHKPNIVVPADG